MGYDCGFDIYPKLKAQEDRHAYERFLYKVIHKYENVVDDNSRREDGKVLEIPWAWTVDCRDQGNVTFMIGECPQIPFRAKHCEYFLRFSSKISGSTNAPAERYIKEVCEIAKAYFGERVHFWHRVNDTDNERSRGVYNEEQIRDASNELKTEVINTIDLLRLQRASGSTVDGSRSGQHAVGSVAARQADAAIEVSDD